MGARDCGARRTMKDIEYTTKEITKQEELIEKYKADPERDEHDVKKQREVMQEYLDTKPREHSALLDGYEKLLELVQIAVEEDNKDLMATDEFVKAKDSLVAASAVLIAVDKLEKEDAYQP